MNIEKVLNLAPDLILAYDSGVRIMMLSEIVGSTYKTAVVGEHAESDPLDGLKWEKFIALFFNREGEAERISVKRRTSNLALKKVTADVVKTSKCIVEF